MTQKWYTAQELADYLQRHLVTIQRWRREGRIKGYPLRPATSAHPAQDYRYPASEIELFMMALAEDEDAPD